MNDEKLQILLTNDDGIQSPGLWEAAEALSEIGYVWVIAPREQSSGMGRSMPNTSDGIITPQQMMVRGKEWTVYAVGGSPAQAVQHGILEIMPQKPDLIISGINYGANIGTGVTVSGTVGAALEGAAHGIPAMAISLETAIEYHVSYSKDVDFSTAGEFTKQFAQAAVNTIPKWDYKVLKVEVPSGATPNTAWKICSLCPIPFYIPLKPNRTDWSKPTRIPYALQEDFSLFEEGTDTHTLLIEKKVAVTPLSLDLSTRNDVQELELFIRKSIPA